jgi:hypothetical protein
VQPERNYERIKRHSAAGAKGVSGSGRGLILIKLVKDTVEEAVADDGSFDRYELFRAFRRAVERKCNTREAVPSHYVRIN